MHISKFNIRNFKSFKNIVIHLNSNINILTGINNSGKTTLLEAIALWYECFTKLIRVAEKTVANRYQRGDYVLGNTQVRYFSFDEINSVRSPNLEDIFYQRDISNHIRLSATLSGPNAGESIEIAFFIKSANGGQRYDITLENFQTYDFERFNHFFNYLPEPIGLLYASPIAAIPPVEPFRTQPQVKDAITKREASSVVRNRLYQLQHAADPNLFQKLLIDLNKVLYNNSNNLRLISNSNIQQDTYVRFITQSFEQDIALLGSGTLQIIEILLNLYQPDASRKDFSLILLDEPDSHIHREVQKRLLERLTQTGGSQILLSTHNEALIRAADPATVFHLEEANHRAGNSPKVYRPLASPGGLPAVASRFSGIYPAANRAVVSSLSGDSTALDFLNAIEADQILFIEGQDDAQAFHWLLHQASNGRKKYTYWVLGGIANAWEKLGHYQTVFSAIRNRQSLWEKAVLILDRDFLNDAHTRQLPEVMREHLQLRAHCWDAYTFEATLLTDLSRLADLLNRLISTSRPEFIHTDLQPALQTTYDAFGTTLRARFTDKTIEDAAHRYRAVRDKVQGITKHSWIRENDVQLQTLVRNHQDQVLLRKEYYKMMTKEDVETVINQALNAAQVIDFEWNAERDFLPTVQQVRNLGEWFPVWEFLKSI